MVHRTMQRRHSSSSSTHSTRCLALNSSCQPMGPALASTSHAPAANSELMLLLTELILVAAHRRLSVHLRPGMRELGLNQPLPLHTTSAALLSQHVCVWR